MSGKISADRGKRHERDMARELSDIVPEGKVITSRDGRGGAQGGADLLWLLEDGTKRPDVLGWSVECKTTAGRFPTHTTWRKWMVQAERDASAVRVPTQSGGWMHSARPVVLYRQHGRRDCWAAVQAGDDVSLVPLDVWLRRVAREGEK